MKLNLKPTKRIQIAIDGPAGSGKSTVAQALSKKLNITYIDTGAMYRAVAFLGLQHQLNLKDEKKLINLIKKSFIELSPPKQNSHYCTVVLNNQDVTDKIRSQEISWETAVVATLPKVREYLVKIQQSLAKKQSVIMEGRDITSVVLPNASLKIYMTASLKDRAKRRYLELKNKGQTHSFIEILKDTKRRDYQDSNRDINPLHVVPDAWILDTTKMTIKQVVDAIIKKQNHTSKV